MVVEVILATLFGWSLIRKKTSKLPREKNTKEVIRKHKATRMVEDGEDLRGLQTTTLQEAQNVT